MCEGLLPLLLLRGIKWRLWNRRHWLGACHMGKGVSEEATAGADGYGRRRQTVTVLAVVSLAFALLLVSI